MKSYFLKVWTLVIALLIRSQTRDQQRFTISKVAADWHQPMVKPQRIMWPSIARTNGQWTDTRTLVSQMRSSFGDRTLAAAGPHLEQSVAQSQTMWASKTTAQC